MQNKQMTSRNKRKVPSGVKLVDISELTELEFNKELMKGYKDIQEERTRNAQDVFDDIRKDYGLKDL